MGLLDSLKGLFGGKKSPGSSFAPRKKIAPTKLSSRFSDMTLLRGQGSMSKVFKAYDRTLGRQICLKVLDKAKTAKFEARFIGLERPPEGEICSRLKHPNIVTTYDHGISTDGEPFLVMEWVQGAGLNFLIETHDPTLSGRRLNLLIQIAEGLEYMHQMRLIHRDLCPRNIMVTNEGKVQLIDFGLTIPWTPDFCRPGNRTGSADYLAPEIIKRMPTDNRVDLFALGVTAFEVLTGGVPWDRTGESAERLKRMINVPPKDPRELWPDIPESLARILLKAIARDRDQRFPTAAAFRDALRAVAEVESV